MKLTKEELSILHFACGQLLMTDPNVTTEAKKQLIGLLDKLVKEMRKCP